MNKISRIKNADYTTISNVFLRDDGLSLKAKGLLAVVLSLPEAWDFSIVGLCSVIKEGKACVYSAIDELKARGYCIVVTNRNEKGVIVGNDYTFFENPYTENPNVDNQPQIDIEDNNITTCNIINNKKEKTIDKKKTRKELFEDCWVAYKRKGIKKIAFEQWCKLTDSEKDSVMPHIKAYTQVREKVYQKDFERYLRDKVFTTIVFSGNNIVYDPTKNDADETTYNPICGGALSWNDYYRCYMYVGFWDGVHIADGYTDDTRPDGASITLNNGRGTLVWNSETKTWNKI